MGIYIEKEDIYIAIAKSAMTKMKFLFSEDNDNTYVHNGREYREYDVPVFIVLSGFAYGKSLVNIYHQCVMQMISRGYSPDSEKLNRIVAIVGKDCKDEINILKETDRRLISHESPNSIFNDIVELLAK